MSDETIARRIRVSGRVQGVFFRDTCRREASSHGVAGWVRNCSDGSVEAVFEGPPEAVSALVDFARARPGTAQGDALDAEPEEPEGLESFDVR